MLTSRSRRSAATPTAHAPAARRERRRESAAAARARLSRRDREHFQADDDVDAALRLLAEINRGAHGACDLVVAVSHVRTGRDLVFYDRAMRAGHKLDAILGGHDHFPVAMKLRWGAQVTQRARRGTGVFLKKAEKN